METATNIATLVSGFMDLVLFAIAIYTFYLTFMSSRIKLINVGYSFNMWKSDTINTLIKNMTLKTIVISRVYVVFDNKYRLQIGKYEIPKVLESLKSMQIKMEPYTSMNGLSMHELSNMVIGKGNIYLEIITDDSKKLYATMNKKHKPNKKADLEDIELSVRQVGDIILKDDFKYMLTYKINGSSNIETAFINDGGFISTDIFGFNAIPKEYLSNIENVKRCFDEPCRKFCITLSISNVNDI